MHYNSKNHSRLSTGCKNSKWKRESSELGELLRMFFSSLLLTSLLLTASPLAYANEGVFISEIAWMGTEVSSNDEWIELYNPSDVPVDLAGWSLRADDGAPEISLAGSVDAYGYYLLERTDDDTVPELVASQIYTGTLGNTDEALGFYNPLGELVDYVAEWFAGDNETKETMQRADDGTWCTAVGTPGAQNICVLDPDPPEDPIQEEDDIVETRDLASLRISEVQANGVGLDYVEIECLEGSDVPVADIFVNGKSADTTDVIQAGERILFLLGSGDPSAGSGPSGGTSGVKEYKISGSGISGTQGEVELGYSDASIEAVCWNPGGVVDETDANQMDLRERGLWEGACMNSRMLSVNVVLARNADGGWAYDHPTPGLENTFVNQPPVAVITVQGSGLTEAQNTLTFNPTGEDSSDPDSDPLTYFWDFGDGDFFEGKNPTSRVYGIGNFVVTLTVADPFGAQSVATQNLSITAPSSGGAGAVILLTSSEEKSYDFSDKIFINEIFPNPVGKDSEGEFIELINLDSRTVDLAGWKLDDEEGGSAPYLLDGSMRPNEKRAFFITETKLSLKNTSEYVRLFNPNSLLVDEVLYEGAKEGMSYSRRDDGSFEWSSPTPGQENDVFDYEKFSSGVVSRCIDGDTFEARFDDKTVSVRLLGIDAPETTHPDKDAEYYGEEASLYLCGLLLDKKVSLTFDETKFDTYDRLLAYVYLGDVFVNMHLLEEGYVRLYDRFNFEKMEEFREAEASAQDKQVGLWAIYRKQGDCGEQGEQGDCGEQGEQPPNQMSLATAQGKADIRFTEFLINPAGADEGKEYFVLKNFGEHEVSLEGLKLVNNGKSKVFGKLTLQAGEERKFTSANISFSFRNTSGSIELVASSGETIDSFTYEEKVTDDEVFYLDLVELEWKSSLPEAEPDEDEAQFGFEELISGVPMEKRILSHVRVADISRLKEGIVGVIDNAYCYHVFFDADKQTSLLLTLLYRQASSVSIEQTCFSNFCVLSRFIF